MGWRDTGSTALGYHDPFEVGDPNPRPESAQDLGLLPGAGLIPAVTSPAGGPAVLPLCSAPGSRSSGGAEMTDGAGRATEECCGVGLWVRGAPLLPCLPLSPPFPPWPLPAVPGGRLLWSSLAASSPRFLSLLPGTHDVVPGGEDGGSGHLAEKSSRLHSSLAARRIKSPRSSEGGQELPLWWLQQR